MFQKPSTLDNLRNKEQQHKAAKTALNQANTYLDIIWCFILERKQYDQYLQALAEFQLQKIGIDLTTHKESDFCDACGQLRTTQNCDYCDS